MQVSASMAENTANGMCVCVVGGGRQIKISPRTSHLTLRIQMLTPSP